MIRTNVKDIDVHQYLRGLRYPATKQDLINKAKHHRADNDVLQLLWKLNQRKFNSPDELTRVIEEQDL